MQSDLDKAIKIQPLTDDQVQLLIYQILRGLKVYYIDQHKYHIVLMSHYYMYNIFLVIVHSFSWCYS